MPNISSNLPNMGPKDPFFIWVGNVLTLIQKNTRILVIILMVIIVGIAGLMFAKSKAEKDVVKLNQDIFVASLTTNAPEELAKVVSQWGDDKTLVAKLALVHLALEKKDWAGAIAQIDSALKTASDSLKPVLVSSRIQVLWQQGKNDEALKTADDYLLTKPSGVASQYVQLIKAEILNAAGKKDEAMTIYAALSKESGSEVISNLVQARLQIVGESK